MNRWFKLGTLAAILAVVAILALGASAFAQGPSPQTTPPAYGQGLGMGYGTGLGRMGSGNWSGPQNSLADAGQLPLNLQVLDVAPVLRAAEAQFSLAAEVQKVRLEVNAAENLPCVHADADRIAQVLRNLLANALRHTPEGGRITMAGTAQDGRVKVTVCDTGEGIAADDLPHVFERFYRGDKSRSRASGSTGLGMAIAQAWMKAMGGEIGVESIVGRGSCFWLMLPIVVGS